MAEDMVKETDKNLEEQSYRIDDILSALMRIEDNQCKYVLTTYFNPMSLLKIYETKESTDLTIKELESRIFLYETILKAIHLLTDELQVPSEDMNTGYTIMKLDNSLNENEKAVLRDAMLAKDDLDSSVANLKRIYENADPIVRNLCSGAIMKAEQAVDDYEKLLR